MKWKYALLLCSIVMALASIASAIDYYADDVHDKGDASWSVISLIGATIAFFMFRAEK